MDLTVVAFPLAWVTLMSAPLLALAVRFWSARPTELAMRGGIVLALVVLAWLLSVEFAWRPLNWLALAAAYLAWSVIVGTAFTVRPRPVGVFAGVLGMLTFLPGLLLGTIGILGLMFIVADYSGAPVRSATLMPGLDCVVTNWGNVTSDDGRDVHLYRYLPWFPVLRHQVAHVIVNETNPKPGLPANTGCREVASGER